MAAVLVLVAGFVRIMRVIMTATAIPIDRVAVAQQHAAGFDAAAIAEIHGATRDEIEHMLRDHENTARELGILTRDELSLLPPVEPLIENTLDRRTLAVLGGYWGTGKSFIGVDLACSVATGKRWQGRRIHRPGHVLYIAAEGVSGYNARISAWEYAWGQKADAVSILPRPINLMNRTATATIAEYADDAQIELIVIDTLSRCMVGADENAARDMSVAVEQLDVLRKAGTGRTVLVVHHTGKDAKTMRGSSVLEAAADTVYMTEKTGAVNLRLERTKRKDGPTDDRHDFRLNVPVGMTAPIVSKFDISFDTGGNAEKLMSIFMSNFSETGASKSDLRASADMPPGSFSYALNSLVKKGALRNEGTGKQTHYVLARS